MKKKLPKFKTDAEAEAFVDKADLREYDFAGMTPMRFKLKRKKRGSMSNPDTYVRARIDVATKKRAARVLAKMGLTISDAIRLLMMRIAADKRLPFGITEPKRVTRKK